MNRFVLLGALAAAYFAYSNLDRLRPPPAPIPAPTPVPVPSPPPAPAPVAVKIPALLPYAQQMTADERRAMGQAYDILAKSIDADPRNEPVFHRVASVREAHRGTLLVLWTSVLGNSPSKYPGFGPKLEELLTTAVGATDVPLSEPIRTSASNLFRDIAQTLQAVQ